MRQNALMQIESTASNSIECIEIINEKMQRQTWSKLQCNLIDRNSTTKKTKGYQTSPAAFIHFHRLRGHVDHPW